MTNPVRPTGSPCSRIMIVGEAPGQEEERVGTAFYGSSGWELDKMLKEAGLNRTLCFVTNVVRYRPPENKISKWIAFKKKDITPDHVMVRGLPVLPIVKEGFDLLQQEIDMVKPDLIIVMGKIALWALTGKTDISKWRGSMLFSDEGIRLLPTYHPAYILRQWELRPILVQDLRRASYYKDKPWPETGWNFIVRPTFEQVVWHLNALYDDCELRSTMLSVDIETRAYNIACIGIAWNKHSAICIPLMVLENNDGYWTEAEEAEIAYLLYRLLTHPNARILGQNFIFDAQYIFRAWHFIPQFSRDTMLGHHVCFPSMQKSLDFICSMHNDHYVFWKDDGKTLSLDRDENKHWAYNDEDCVRTYEADESLQQTIDAMGLREPHDFQMSLFRPVLKMMNRGCLIDEVELKVFTKALQKLEKEVLGWIHSVVGYPLNPRSHPQMTRFFYYEMGMPKQYKKGEGTVTCDSGALEKVGDKEPLLRPLIAKIEEWRSIQVFLTNFLKDKRDADGRMRCSYNIGGTYTFRFSSSENAFGKGLNLQNIPKGDEDA